jgi:hypothetical protein
MNPSRPKTRRPRTTSIAPEVLEGRELLTGGVGDTFAIIPATIKAAGGHATVSFNLDPKLFTDPGNKPFVLGIDVAPNQGSAANPVIRSVTSPAGINLPTTHAAFDPKVNRTGTQTHSNVSSAALVTIPGLQSKNAAATTTYKVNIDARGKTSGSILVGFYLPGNAGGGGVVNQADINAIKYGLNTTANDTTGKYSFDADVDRNGRIDQKDLAIAQKNFGVGTTVTPVISADLDPTSVTDAKNRTTNLSSVHITGTATPNSVVTYALPNGVPTQAVTGATGKYDVRLNLIPGANTFHVTATDAFNQKIAGSIATLTYNPKV